MYRIGINLNRFTSHEINLIADFFRQGKVIIYPTDTVYGLGCVAIHNKGIDRVTRIKERTKPKPYLILVDSITMAKKYCNISQEQEQYLRVIWPGPTTVILDSKGLLPKTVTAGEETLAMRLPKNHFLITMIGNIKVPLISTSLNITGKKNRRELENLEYYFTKEQPDIIVDAGPLKYSKPSKIIDIRDLNNIKTLRK